MSESSCRHFRWPAAAGKPENWQAILKTMRYRFTSEYQIIARLFCLCLSPVPDCSWVKVCITDLRAVVDVQLSYAGARADLLWQRLDVVAKGSWMQIKSGRYGKSGWRIQVYVWVTTLEHTEQACGFYPIQLYLPAER